MLLCTKSVYLDAPRLAALERGAYNGQKGLTIWDLVRDVSTVLCKSKTLRVKFVFMDCLRFFIEITCCAIVCILFWDF